MHPLTDRYILSQGVRIHALATPSIDPKKTSLVFIPGIMMPAWIWEKQLHYFSKDYNVIAMDLRSQGGSQQTPEGHYAACMAKDIEAVVQGLGIHSFVLIGWSLAVSQAVYYAAQLATKNLTGLVLVDGTVGVDPSWPFYQTMVRQWREFQIDRVAKTEKFIKSIFKHLPSNEYLKRLNDAALQTPTNTVIALIDNYILQDFHSLLPQITIPVLIATTPGPRLTYMEEMLTLLPSGQLEIFQTAGHALFVDQPEQFNEVLNHFIKKCARDRLAP